MSDHRQITIVLSAPMCELIEFARRRGPEVQNLSRFIEERLRESPGLVIKNRLAKIDLGEDADLPDYESLCSGSAAVPASESRAQTTFDEKGGNYRRRVIGCQRLPDSKISAARLSSGV